MQRALISIIVSFIAAALFGGQAYADRADVKVQVDDRLVAFPDALPFIDANDRLQVPLRFVSEELGFQVGWKLEQDKRVSVTLNKTGMAIGLTTGQSAVRVNGAPVSFDSAPLFRDGRVYVPLRFIADTLRIRIQWDNENRIAILDRDGRYHAPAWYAPVQPAAADFVATAYSSSPAENGWGAVDYFGNPLQLGTIAVDPAVIPFGSKVWITGYDSPELPAGGMQAIATDAGSAIKGNRIDIYIPGARAKASAFGIQNVKLTVLSP